LMSVELLEEIRLLGNTDTYHEKLLQIVLCGQPELFAVLQRPELQALQQRIAGTSLLRPLSLPETRAYIAERLHAAGLRGSSPFTGTAVERIHKLSNGVPRLINLLCDGCLSVGFELKRKQIDALIVDQASEDVLGLLKAPVPPRGLTPTDSKPEKEAESEELEAPAEVRASAKSASTADPTVAVAQTTDDLTDIVANSNSAATKPAPAPAAAAAETADGRAAKNGDGNWSKKSTFDVLISALKQGRAVANE
jgi:hypothetical protein